MKKSNPTFASKKPIVNSRAQNAKSKESEEIERLKKREEQLMKVNDEIACQLTVLSEAYSQLQHEHEALKASLQRRQEDDIAMRMSMLALQHPELGAELDMLLNAPEANHQQDDMTYEEMLAVSEQIGTVPTGLTSQEFMKVPVTILREETTCSICMENAAVGTRMKKLPKCKHMYHPNCIKEWFNSKSTCPVCLMSVK